MSTFLDIASPLAGRGFRIFPLAPEDKRPVKMSWGDHFDAATTDITALEQWSREIPRANVGISPDENFCFLETDDEAGLKAACADLEPEIWDTTRVSARHNRCYYIFRQTMRTRKVGNMTMTRAGQENLYEFKQHRVYVTGPGSIHPKTGGPYAAEWRTIPAMPDILLDRLCALYGAPKATESHKMDAETTRQIALLDKFLETYEMATTGDWFNKGQQWYRPIVCPWEGVHENGNQGTSTCIVYTEGGGYGFDCKHRCASKTWKEFRAQVQEGFPDRKFSFVDSTAEVVMGGTSQRTAQAVEIVEELDPELRATPLPKYPIDAFDGTLYLDFAKCAAKGNYVPLEFFVEGAMTYSGAIAALSVRHKRSEVITPRLYTVLLAMAGIGKGTTFRLIRKFAPPHRVMDDVNSEKAIPRPCSALLARPASENGLNDALLKHAHVLLEFEEMDRLMEKTEIKGSGGALMSIIRTCFDDIRPGITTCKGREVVAETAFLSLLGAMTPSLWRRAMEGRDSYGSGLGGRFNLVASNEDRTASTLVNMDVGDLETRLETFLTKLDGETAVIDTADAALKLLDEWWNDNSRGKPHYNRVNVITHRKALHLAWIRGLTVITPEIMRQALRLADYLVSVRDVFAVSKGEDRAAIGENRVLHILKQIAPKAVRAKQIVDFLDGMMSRASVFRALESLASSGEVEKIIRKDTGCAKPYGVYRVSLK
jgi:hypothetical protein